MKNCNICNYDYPDYMIGFCLSKTDEPSCPQCSAWLDEFTYNHNIREYMKLYNETGQEKADTPELKRTKSSLLQTIEVTDRFIIPIEDTAEENFDFMKEKTEDVYRIFMHYYGKFVDVEDVYVTVKYTTPFHGEFKWTAHRYSTGIEVSQTI